MDDETPRAKRRVRAMATPTASNEDRPTTPIVGHRHNPSLRSSTSTTSRSSSPGKRQREAEIEFSKPAIRFHTSSDAQAWKEKHTGRVPLMAGLSKCVNAEYSSEELARPQTQHKLRNILKDMNRCKDRDATEEAWSDAVVYPVLSLAKELSQTGQAVDVINVKAIDVWPADLLPTNAQNRAIGKKRVDYSIGIEIADSEEMFSILRRMENHTITQSNHKMLRDRALCSHLEIKTERSVEDGRSQLSTWCAAGFQKQESLWAQRNWHVRSPRMPSLAPVPLWIWKEKTLQLYVAVMDSESSTVHVLDEKVFLIDDREVESLLRVITVIAAVMDWGGTCYLPWLKAHIGVDEEKRGQ